MTDQDPPRASPASDHTVNPATALARSIFAGVLRSAPSRSSAGVPEQNRCGRSDRQNTRYSLGNRGAAPGRVGIRATRMLCPSCRRRQEHQHGRPAIFGACMTRALRPSLLFHVRDIRWNIALRCGCIHGLRHGIPGEPNMDSARRRLLGRILAVATVAWGVPQPKPAEAQGGDLVVFAAASLKNALDAIHAQWQKETGKIAKISYAASSALAKQIENGAPAQMFISADLDWMDYV